MEKRDVGFTEEEAEFFGGIVKMQIEDKKVRIPVKKKKEKKPPKMKRSELLKRLLVFLEHGVLSVAPEADSEWLLLRNELRRIVK
jgi:hypothetical protein